MSLSNTRARRRSSLPFVTLLCSVLAVQPLSTHRVKPRKNARAPSEKKPPSKAGRRRTNKTLISLPNVDSQLDYARNGHCVIRRGLGSNDLIQDIKGRVLKYANEKELKAWKQKVQVASNDVKVTKSCSSIKDCKAALTNILGESPDLPFLQYFNLWRDIPELLNLARSLARTAGILMDVDSVRLYQDALFWKRAGDGPTPWHVDARMAPFDTSNFVTFWIPLQDVPAGGTGLLFCSKSHNDFALPYWNSLERTPKDPKSPWNDLGSRYAADPVDYMPLRVGDFTAHSGWTLHCSDPNSAHNDRLALAISFVDGKAPVRADALDERTTDNEDIWSYESWVRKVPARKASFEHPLVPILWRQKRSQ